MECPWADGSLGGIKESGLWSACPWMPDLGSSASVWLNSFGLHFRRSGFLLSFSRQRERVQRIARAHDDVLLTVQRPRRRTVAHARSQSLMPQNFSLRGIEC